MHPRYDTIVEIYMGLNIGVDRPIEQRATTQMRMIHTFFQYFNYDEIIARAWHGYPY
jgi:hypothetical protein